MLLHLSHPFPIKNLQTAVGHVKRFREHLGSLSPKAKNSQIAREVLLDAVDCSGVDIYALPKLLNECLANTAKESGA